MRMYIFFIILFLAFVSCKEERLNNMGEAVERQFMYKDQENKTKTVIERCVAISYDEIDENKREQTEDYYLTKVYVRGRWSYLEGSRVYNIDDTLNCYFDKDTKFLRFAHIKE